MTPDLDAVRAMMEDVRSGRTPGSPHQWTVTPVHLSLCDMLEALAAEVEANRATIAGLEARVEALTDGARPLPIDRETLGRMVREAWVRWAQTQPNPKASWLAPYDDLAEPDKEADRQIGETIARWTLIHDAARLALSGGTPDGH